MLLEYDVGRTSRFGQRKVECLRVIKEAENKVDKAYNKKVKVKSFSNGDLVWKVILRMDRKDRTLGKWSPK